MIRIKKATKQTAALFEGWEETILWSCLQGIMGALYINDRKHPVSAMAALGDFTFFAGKASAELAAYKPPQNKKGFSIMIPQNREWKETLLACHKDRAKIVSRYATKKEPGIFDKEKLKKIISLLPDGYELNRINRPLYEQCKAETFSADLVSQFPRYEDYQKLGLGAVIQKDSRIVSGASSYSRYRHGIEIEIDTHKEFRRKGLALICGAKLILECLERNLYPSWDAQNTASLALAKKLGYRYSHTYEAVELCSEPPGAAV